MKKIDEYSDRELLLLILTNQAQIFREIRTLTIGHNDKLLNDHENLEILISKHELTKVEFDRLISENRDK